MAAQTIILRNRPYILGWGSAVGKKESEGPLGKKFGQVFRDSRAGGTTWEDGECALQHASFQLALEMAHLQNGQVNAVFGGDLLNQCISTSGSLKDRNIPFFGLYGACSTMAEGLGLAVLLCDGASVEVCGALTSSHFCTSERQFRTPLEYGGQRTPTAQWTATASGTVLVGSKPGTGPRHIRATHMTVGKIVDRSITDVNNMGAAMAPAAADTLSRHFRDTGRSPSDYDCIVTGDLGLLGRKLVRTLLADTPYALGGTYNDCGAMLYHIKQQDVHCGGSGCGCSAAVLCGELLPQLEAGSIQRLLFCGTGALHSPVSLQQGRSIPGICHAVALEHWEGEH